MPGSLESANRRAVELDARFAASVADIGLLAPSLLFKQIRQYLQQQTDRSPNCRGNNPYQLVHLAEPDRGALITVGPTIDKGPTPEHFNFTSGARLSFGITLRDEGGSWRLLSYRFHLHLATNHPLGFLRYDLIDHQHQDPLAEARSHLHIGDHVVHPFPVLSPLEVLDCVFFLIQP